MRAISDAAHAVGAPVLADGAQGAGAIDVDPGRARRGRLRRAGPEMAVRAERRRLPVGCGRIRGALRGRGAELLHARLPQRGAAVLARRAAARRRVADDVGARRPGRGGRRSGASSWAGRRAPRRWRTCARAASSCSRRVPGVTLQAETEGAAPLVAFTVAGHSAEDVVKALEAKGVLARSLPGPRLGARLARLLALGQRSRAPRRRAPLAGATWWPRRLHARGERRRARARAA